MLEPSHATPSPSEGVDRKPYTIDIHVAGAGATHFPTELVLLVIYLTLEGLL